ncbi:MAG: hypothetical protein JSV83_13495 [Desulfobacterales bacterium]|nr:MAG: hypothetical protein JSV83_13495 [Desulfobacterales bacterium]
MEKQRLCQLLNNQRGVSAVIIAICLIMLVGFIALAIDVGHLMVARNELQNAADAGALAGAGNLYLDDGTAVNPNANQFGYDAAIANLSERVPVEVNWPGENTGDVQRGHWSFGLGALPRGFYPNASLDTVDLWNATTEELDANLNFINAVRVRTRRHSTPIASYFARIFGFQSFQGSAEAVAYIGFAGTLTDDAVGAPIAICMQALRQVDGSYDCTFGRFINDAAGGQDEETGMWTSLEQFLNTDGTPDGWEPGDLPCDPFPGGAANTPDVRPLIQCGEEGVNDNFLYLGMGMQVNNGQISSAFQDFYACYTAAEEDPGFLRMTLPVIDCIDDPTTCAPLVGAVEVYVVHVTWNPDYNDLPPSKPAIYDNEGTVMYNAWERPTPDPSELPDGMSPEEFIWNSFADNYTLIDRNGVRAEYQMKTIYLLPSCRDHIPEGVTGGENFGILAEIPVLVD